MGTPARRVGGAPRTPDPASMGNGAFAGMDLSNSFPSTPRRLGPGPPTQRGVGPFTPTPAGPLPSTPRHLAPFTPTHRHPGPFPLTRQHLGPFTPTHPPLGPLTPTPPYPTSFTSTPQHVGPSSMALVTVDEAAVDNNSLPDFEKVFHMAERYSYSHLNYPSAAKDSQLHPSIKERLMKAATRETAHQIGSTGATRYFLMTKVIIQWIVKHVFKQTLFSTFDLDADLRITTYRDSIYQDTPPLVKFQLLSEIGKEIRQIRARPNFSQFLASLVRNQANRLWAIVQPLMHQTTTMDWEDLHTLMHEAYIVAGDMAALPFEWRFDFATIGSPYDASMVNQDPYVQGNEEELARRGYPVRLGHAPAVFYRDNSGDTARTGRVTRAKVLLKS